MKQLTAVLGLALLSLCNAVSPMLPEPPLPPLISEDCNATDVTAGLALDEINKDLDKGYVLSLFRVVDAHRQPVGPGNIYYLTIDVLETDCHVLSGKSWKDCNIRSMHQSVFGRCKAVFYLNLPFRRVRLYSYSCTLSTVPGRVISRFCPDCPVLSKDTDSYIPKAESMVVKYNKESNNTHNFKLVEIERASMQWVFGAAYFTEFTIKETNCSKEEADVSHCQFLDDEHAHVGVCKGSMFEKPGDLGISVSCVIYDPKKTGHPHPRHHDHHGEDHPGHGNGHRHQNHRHDHHHPHEQNATHSEDGQHHHKENHDQKHEHGTPPTEPSNHPDQKHHGSSSEEHTGPKPAHPPPKGPISTVIHYHMANETDFFPEPTIADCSPPVVHPESPPPSQEPTGPEGPVAPAPFHPFKDPVPQPFPHHPSNSPECPAKPKHQLPVIESLLPVPKHHLIEQKE